MWVVACSYLSAPGETLDVEPAKFGEALTEHTMLMVTPSQ